MPGQRRQVEHLAGAGEDLGLDDIGLALADDRTPQPGGMPRTDHMHCATCILDSDRERAPRHVIEVAQS